MEDRKTGRQEDRKTGGQEDRKTGRQEDRKKGRQEDRKIGRLEDWKTGRQEDRRTGRQEDRKKGRQKNLPDASAHRELTEEGDHYNSDDDPSVPVLPLAEDNRNSIEEAFEVEDVLGSDLSNSLLFLHNKDDIKESQKVAARGHRNHA